MKGTRVGAIGRGVAAGCLVIGPAAAVGYESTSPIGPSDTTARQVAEAAAHPTAMDFALAFDLLGLLLVPGVVLVAWLAHTRAPRLATLAGMVAFAGYLCLTVVAAGDALLVAAAESPERATAVALVHDFWDVGLSAAMLGVYLAGHIIGVVLLAVALWRSRVVPRWAAAALGALPVFEVLEQASGTKLWGALGYALVTIAFASCAARLVQGRAADCPSTAPARTGMAAG